MRTSTKILASLGAALLGGMGVSVGRKAGHGLGGPASGSGQTQRHVRDLENLPRSAALSHLYRATEAAALPNHPPESMFAPSAIWEWVKSYLA
jgi:hypothetical protein